MTETLSLHAESLTDLPAERQPMSPSAARPSGVQDLPGGTHDVPASVQEKTRKLLGALWQRNQPQVLERIEFLARAAHDACTAELPQDIREQAISTAHKLAGSLGMFGFHQATALARAFEHELESDAHSPTRLVSLATQLHEALFPG